MMMVIAPVVRWQWCGLQHVAASLIIVVIVTMTFMVMTCQHVSECIISLVVVVVVVI